MSYHDAIKSLQTKYHIVDTINLSDHDDHKIETLVGVLTPYQDPVFAPNELIVFIVDRTLKRSFESEPPDILTKLQQRLRYFNIPHEHLMVVSNIDNIAELLAYLKNKYYYQQLSPIPHTNV